MEMVHFWTKTTLFWLKIYIIIREMCFDSIFYIFVGKNWSSYLNSSIKSYCYGNGSFLNQNYAFPTEDTHLNQKMWKCIQLKQRSVFWRYFLYFRLKNRSSRLKSSIKSYFYGNAFTIGNVRLTFAKRGNGICELEEMGWLCTV